MVDLNKICQTEFKGKITFAKTMQLGEWLQSKKNPVPESNMKKFSGLERDNICIVAEVEGGSVDGFFLIPKATGYTKSNLKRLIDKNGLPLVDTDDLSSWLGKEVMVTVSGEGYYRIAV